MSREDVFADRSELVADLNMLETVRWYRMKFTERLTAASGNQDQEILEMLRLEATYQLAEFYYGLKAHGIEAPDDIERLADAHNDYIVSLTNDPAKMRRLGLKKERLLEAMFAAETRPRLVEIWRQQPGTIDQSNLGRLLTVVMSAETCRKACVACAEAGFLERRETSYGPTLVVSRGVLEDTLGLCLREARQRVVGTRRDL
jgi:hypothetical protein